jgi:hypothetical protein
LIQERTRRGRLFAARQGRVNWGGNPPYGYRYIRKTETTPQQLVIDAAEAAIVQQMYRWLVEEELSSYAIQKRLTAQHVPTRGATTRGWAQSSVIKILSTPLYKGAAHYNRTQAGDAQRPYGARSFKDQRPGNGRGRVKRPPDEWICRPGPSAYRFRPLGAGSGTAGPQSGQGPTEQYETSVSVARPPPLRTLWTAASGRLESGRRRTLRLLGALSALEALELRGA